VVREELDAAAHVAAVAIEVDDVQDHLEGSRTEMVDGARWRFTADEAADDAVRIDAELRALG
jgi:predicted secreted protein